jgi:serine protease
MSTRGSDGIGPIQFVYETLQGTSMASPHVAGIAALMKARNPDLTPDRFDALLASGQITEDLGAPGRDDIFGHGLIDARAAVAAAIDEPTPPAPPVLVVNPTALNFGVDLSLATVQALNAGEGALSITGVFQDSGGWLSVAPDQVDASGLGTYAVSVDRTGLLPGTYVAVITFTSTAGPFQVGVVMSVLDTEVSFDSNAGFHHILLVDPQTFQAVAQLDTAPVDGTYPFSFSNVPAGQYFLVGGTDLDNDGFICDGGEACATFPSNDAPLPVRVDRDLSDLEFVTRFPTQVGISGAGATGSPVGARGYQLLPSRE